MTAEQASPMVGGWAFPLAHASSPATNIAPDRSQAETFVRLLFEGMTGFVALRAIEEPAPADRKARVLERWLPINDALPGAVGDYVEECAAIGYAAYLLPHPVSEQGRGLKDILAQRVIPVDIDAGDIGAKARAIGAAVGTPWLTVQSGGVESGQPKLHLYYRLAADAASADFAEVASIREAIAARFGADTKVGKNPAQILRLPGSIHAKGERRLCRLENTDEQSHYDLDALTLAVGAPRATSNVLPFSFDFSRDRPGVDMDRVLLTPILAEGKSEDGLTRYDGAGMALGHYIRMVRDGRLSSEELWQAAREWNAAINVPSWPEEKLRDNLDRLVKRDVEKNGPLVPPAPAIAHDATGLQLKDWYARKAFTGEAPERRWLVDGLIPRGTPGVFAAVGDAGKSMLALQLANHVASSPEAPPAYPVLDIANPTFFGQPVVGRGTAVFLTGEDDHAEVHRRLHTTDPSGAWRAPGSRLIVTPLVSAGGARAYVTSGRQGPEFTPAWRELRAQLEDLPDLALVVLDPLTLFVGGDTNDNAIGAAFMGELTQLAAKTGAAIVLVHHFAKAGTAKITGLSDARTAVLGAGAWVNNARWSVVLWEADQSDAYSTLKALGRAGEARRAGVVYFGGLTKSNAPAAKVVRTLVRGPAGVLEDKSDELRSLAMSPADVDDALYKELCDIKFKTPGFTFTLSPTALWNAMGGVIHLRKLLISKDGKSKGKQGIVDVVNRLIDSGRIAKTDDFNKVRYEPVLP